MVDGQSFSGGKCIKCGARLPPMVDNGGWPIVDCPDPTCGEWYDTQKYRQAGGHFNNNGICGCDGCTK